MVKISRIFVILTAAILVLMFFFFWMNFSVDSYYYWTIGNYLRTGMYKFDVAFMPEFTTPPTVSPPAYGVFLMALENLPAPDIFLHFLQLTLLAGAGFFLYKTLAYFLTRPVAVIWGSILVLIPGNLIYAHLVLTEIGAEFFIALYLWLMVKSWKEKKPIFLAFATALGFAMTTWKYGLLLFGVWAALQLLFIRPKSFGPYLVSSAGIFILILWIITNHTATGVWGLSNYGSMRLWNQIIAEGGVVPDESLQSMQTLRLYVPKDTMIHKNYYDIMYYVLPHVGYDITKVDRILGNVAQDAVRTHPFVYAKTAVNLFFELHKPGNPFWNYSFHFETNKDKQYCGKLGKFQMCRPVVDISHKYATWDSYLHFSVLFYNTIFPLVALGIFIPSLVYFSLRGSTIEKSIVLLYVLGVVPIIFYEHMDPRFIVPFYPLLIAITALGLRKLARHIVVVRQKKG